VKSEEITKVLESLNPAIEAITDQSVKAILNTLLILINEQQKIIEEQKKEIDELKEKLNTNSNNSSKPP
jgi:UTP-glucose-1-phosphate uridylyltransferase